MRRWYLFWGIAIVNGGAVLLVLAKQVPPGLLVSIFGVNMLLVILLHQSMERILKMLVSYSGKKERGSNVENVIKTYIADTIEFEGQVQYIISNINQIGRPAFADMLEKIGNDSIQSALRSASDKIMELRDKEAENNWITTGVAALAEVKQEGKDSSEHAYQIVSTVVKYLSANQGCFYLLKSENDDDCYLELSATYAYGKKKFLEKRIFPGEGLLGQVLFEKDIIYLTEVPKDYVNITSGLGEALPRSICIVPVLTEGNILGAFEIASFQKLTRKDFEYLKRVAASIGHHLGAVEIQKRTEKLLLESQTMTQDLKSQEEELRQNMEELSATQEEMSRRQIEMDAVLSTLSTVELDLAGNIMDANEIFLGITGYKTKDIKGKLYKNLIPQNGTDAMQYEIMWNSILSGRAFSGEFRMINCDQKEMWMAGNFTPLLNKEGKPYKVMVVSLFTTQDKEKLSELQDWVTALKSCIPIAEINSDLTFKSANDLFLTALGIKRLELRKSTPKTILYEDSFKRLEQYYLRETKELPDDLILDVQHKSGNRKCYHSTIMKLNNTADGSKRGLLILRNAV